MPKINDSFRAFAPLLLAFAASAGLALGACAQDDDEYQPSQEVIDSCQAYCAKAAECNDETNEDECYDDCVDAMGKCQVEELDTAVTQLDQCGNETCDDFIGCSVSVGAQCIFGL